MRDEFINKLVLGDVVQLNSSFQNKKQAGLFVTVVEPKAWGIEGYVQVPRGEDSQGPSRIPVKVQWKEMEYVGKAHHFSRKVE